MLCLIKWIFSLGSPVIFQASKVACCTRFPGVKIPFRFWSIDGARLKCRQKYFDTNKNKGYASIQFFFFHVPTGF